MTPGAERFFDMRVRAVVRAAAVTIFLVCLPVTGCSVGLSQVPLPAPGIGGDGFTLSATFSNALNLPAGAKVRVKGADVGKVETMTVKNYAALVTMAIRNGTRLPVGTRAELRSATPLGDVFVALEPPDEAASAPVLGEGDSIPADHTSAGATVEEVLSTAALLVNGGAIRDLTNIVNGIGASVGDTGTELEALIEQSTTLVATLSERTEEIRSVLASANSLASTVTARQQTIDAALSSAAPALKVIDENTQGILATVQQVGQIAQQLARFPSIDGTSAGGMIADINQIAASLNASALAPGASIEAVNRILGPIIKVTNGTSAHVDVVIAQFALGAVSDPNQNADPGSRPPDAGDWARFVGSLTLTMMRLQQHFESPP